MKAPLPRAVAMLLVLLSLANLGAEPLPREPLRPFSEFEHLLFRGALVVAGIVAAWFILVLIRGVLQDRRQTKARQEQARLCLREGFQPRRGDGE